MIFIGFYVVSVASMITIYVGRYVGPERNLLLMLIGYLMLILTMTLMLLVGRGLV